MPKPSLLASIPNDRGWQRNYSSEQKIIEIIQLRGQPDKPLPAVPGLINPVIESPITKEMYYVKMLHLGACSLRLLQHSHTQGRYPGPGAGAQPRGVSAPPAVLPWAPQGKSSRRWERTRSTAPPAPHQREGETGSAVPSNPWKNSLQIKQNKLQQADEYHKFLCWPAKYRCSIFVWDSPRIRPPPCLGSVPGSAERAGMLPFPALRARAQTGESFLLLPRDTDKLVVYRKP